MKRVVITGMGCISAVGEDIETFWGNVRDGRHNFTRLPDDVSLDTGVLYAARIPDFDPQKHDIGKKDARRMDRYAQFALAAASQAMSMAGLDESSIKDPYRAGVIVGSGIGGLETILDQHVKLQEKGPSKISVFFVPMMISNIAAGNISMKYHLTGDNYAIVSACATSAHSIGEAFRKIKDGYLDLCVAGGSEATIESLSLAGFNNMGALCRSDNPDRLSIPFDKERGGFVMGEGAGILVLEELEHAKARGAKIYAEIVGYGATADAYHITSPDPEGKGAGKAMELAMKEAGITPEQVSYINAHGTSTGLNDHYETVAIKRALGDAAYHTAVSSTKGVTGHLLGAAGAIEAIISTLAIRDGVVPPTANYKVPDPDCDLDYITEGPRNMDVEYVLSNAFGFGGHNASLCLKKYRD